MAAFSNIISGRAGIQAIMRKRQAKIGSKVNQKTYSLYVGERPAAPTAFGSVLTSETTLDTGSLEDQIKASPSEE